MKRRVLAGAAAALVVAGLASPAYGAWERVQTLSPGSGSARSIAASDSGKAVVLWAEHGQIMSSTLDRGKFRAPHGIPRSSYDGPPVGILVSIDDRGDAVAAWDDEIEDPQSAYPPGCECTDRVIAAVKPAGRGWLPAQVVSRPHVTSYLQDVAVSPRGAWVMFEDPQPTARGTDASFAFRRTVVLGGFGALAPSVSITDAGTLFQWWQGDAILGRTRTHDGRLGPRRTYLEGDSYTGLQIESTPEGRQAATWQRSGYEGPIKAAVRRPGGRFGRVRVIEPPGGRVGSDLAMAASGDAIVATGRGRASGDVRMRIATAPPEGAFAAPITLNASSGAVPAAAIGSDGTAAAIWLTHDGDAVQAVVRRGRGSFTKPNTLARATPGKPFACHGIDPGWCLSTDVAVTRDGVLALYVGTDGLEVARYR